jgi:hypothetical protein
LLAARHITDELMQLQDAHEHDNVSTSDLKHKTGSKQRPVTLLSVNSQVLFGFVQTAAPKRKALRWPLLHPAMRRRCSCLIPPRAEAVLQAQRPAWATSLLHSVEIWIKILPQASAFKVLAKVVALQLSLLVCLTLLCLQGEELERLVQNPLFRCMQREFNVSMALLKRFAKTALAFLPLTLCFFCVLSVSRLISSWSRLSLRAQRRATTTFVTCSSISRRTRHALFRDTNLLAHATRPLQLPATWQKKTPNIKNMAPHVRLCGLNLRY